MPERVTDELAVPVPLGLWLTEALEEALGVRSPDGEPVPERVDVVLEVELPVAVLLALCVADRVGGREGLCVLLRVTD